MSAISGGFGGKERAHQARYTVKPHEMWSATSHLGQWSDSRLFNETASCSNVLTGQTVRGMVVPSNEEPVRGTGWLGHA